MPTPSAPRSPAFTLIELLTSLAIIAILATILIPVTQSTLRKSENSRCLSNLRQLGAAAILYISDNDNKLPSLNYEYVRDLWPYLYGDTTAPGFSGNPFPKGLRGTSFECPSMDRDIGTISARSYGINSSIRSYYLSGGTIDDRSYKNAPALLVQQPTRTALLADTHGNSYLASERWKASSHRHNGHVNTVFLDGHTESVSGDASEATSINTVFWRGKKI